MKKGWLLLVCAVIAFVVGFCIGPPDFISQVTYGVISGAVCAVSVWVIHKTLLNLSG